MSHPSEYPPTLSAFSASPCGLVACLAGLGEVRVEAVCASCHCHELIDESERCYACGGWECSDCDPRGDEDNPLAYHCGACDPERHEPLAEGSL